MPFEIVWCFSVLEKGSGTFCSGNFDTAFYYYEVLIGEANLFCMFLYLIVYALPLKCVHVKQAP